MQLFSCNRAKRISMLYWNDNEIAGNRLSPYVADTLIVIGTAHNHSTAFARWSQCAHISNTWFLEQLDQFSRFCIANAAFSLHITLLQPVSSKVYPFLCGGIWTLSNTSFLGPHWPTNPNGILIASAIFQKYTLVTNGKADQQTDDRRNTELKR